jgi:hypothetical protein
VRVAAMSIVFVAALKIRLFCGINISRLCFSTEKCQTTRMEA